jgi:hypothetical protein
MEGFLMIAFKQGTDEDEYVAGLRRQIAGHEEAFKCTGCAAAELAMEELRWELRTYLAIGDDIGPVMH